MNKYKKLIASVIVIAMLFGYISPISYANGEINKSNYVKENYCTDIDDSEIKAIKNIYNSLTDKQKVIFVKKLEFYAENGYPQLLDLHKKYVNLGCDAKNVLGSNEKIFQNFGSSAISQLAPRLFSLGLSESVVYAFEAFAATVAVPGYVADVAAGMVLVGVLIAHKDEVLKNWNAIVEIVTDVVGDTVSSTLNFVKKKLKNDTKLPTKDEFLDFDDHYSRHAKEFVDMPGGNGKKPDKEGYWRMARYFLAKEGPDIVKAFKKGSKKKVVKFSTETFEFMIYNIKSGKIYTYFLPRWHYFYKLNESGKRKLAENLSKWARKAAKYFYKVIDPNRIMKIK